MPVFLWERTPEHGWKGPRAGRGVWVTTLHLAGDPASHNTAAYEKTAGYLHSGKSPWYGGGRVIQSGDTLEIRNGVTLTFDFENKEKMYRRFALAMTWDKLSESGPVVSEDISITGTGTIRGIGVESI